MTFSLTVGDIEDAAQRIAGQAYLTPLLSNAQLDAVTGAEVFLKCENLQRTGSFKFRGAYSALSAMDSGERRRGIVAVSSGNHAQGIAEACRLFDVPGTIIMPHDAPDIKKQRVRRSGADIVGYNRASEDRDEIALGLAEERGRAFVHPYENHWVMAGQGTAGLEITEQMADMSKSPQVALICCGGGGLCAGVSTALRHAYPAADIYAVEPMGFDDTARSLRSGRREANETNASSICDSILTKMPGERTFPINSANGVQGLVVSDDEVRAAMRFAYYELKLIVEPGGAVCLAALLSKKIDVSGKTVVAVLSGGNVDANVFWQAIDGPEAQSGTN
ncbi:MAG: threonine/serine dehydratase [Pseudomonadota bacterium]